MKRARAFVESLVCPLNNATSSEKVRVSDTGHGVLVMHAFFRRIKDGMKARVKRDAAFEHTGIQVDADLTRFFFYRWQLLKGKLDNSSFTGCLYKSGSFFAVLRGWFSTKRC